MFEREEVDRWRRQLNAMLAKAGSDDPEGFAEVVALLAEAQAGLSDAASMLRERDGYSWADLARPLGMARQSVAERFGRRRGHLGCGHCGADRLVAKATCPTVAHRAVA